ncbi:type II toxin-antitoxin system RelE/ParE family toxin [Prolixibacter bellariivorans]|uniref:type II toxin-antitoxin system RelE/ParE family toxin n=1 Tax=Prolixibacter bellariivorans TaxID=314319 RepID=UPI000471B093|nr:type II toxin-antitoxin system RelE/ParE family toxin [Prolixibacter bellariivorans]
MTERKVILTPKAENEFSQLRDFLSGEWSPRVGINLERKIDWLLEKLVRDPESFPITTSGDYRIARPGRTTSVFFTFDDREICIQSIVDSRLNTKANNT